MKAVLIMPLVAALAWGCDVRSSSTPPASIPAKTAPDAAAPSAAPTGSAPATASTYTLAVTGMT